MFHLETFIEAMNYRGMKKSMMIKYLRQRQRLGNRIITADESETAAIFVCKSTLARFDRPSIVAIFPNPAWTDVFDDIWAAKLTGGTVNWDRDYVNQFVVADGDSDR